MIYNCLLPILFTVLSFSTSQTQSILKANDYFNQGAIKTELIIELANGEISMIQYAQPFYGSIKKGQITSTQMDTLTIEIDSMTQISLNTGTATMPWRSFKDDKYLIYCNPSGVYELYELKSGQKHLITESFSTIASPDSLNSIERWLLEK